MAEETDFSRTEPASPRRLQQARSAGDVPRSAELTAWLVLLAALGALGWQAPGLFEALQGLAAAAYTHAASPLSPMILQAAQPVLWTLLGVLAVIFMAALAAPMVLSGWVFAPRIVEADLARANPFKPLVRLLSAHSLFDASLTLLKLALAGAAVTWSLASSWPGLHSLSDGGMQGALAATAAWVGRGVLALAAALLLAAALDAGWRRWRYLRRHAMSWQEVLAEAREAEVRPEVRARLRERQQQAGEGSGGGPLPNPPPKGEGANVMPNTVNEVIG